MFRFTDLNALNHPVASEIGERHRGESSAMEIETTDNNEAQINGHQSVFKKLANRHVLLKFVDVVYKIKVRESGMLKMKKADGEDRIILNGVSGIVYPGEILAMLGPSGSGKTTLLTALGGRHGSSGTLAGTITYNGKPFSNSLKRETGFVTQDDVLYPHLTVTETLVFTALLRLPNTITKEMKILQAEAVIAQLGLTKCKDSIVGGNFLRGVSGGERKRVSIGQEMLINPSLIFLDEPTSGLDSTTAQRIISTVMELASGGRTIVMTIHQPSSRLYYMFHKVLLLSDGNTMYFGKGSDAMNYFSRIGFAPTVAMNPADFLLDLANGVSSDESRDSQVMLVKQELVSAFKRNIGNNLVIELLEEANNVVQDSLSNDEQRGGDWPTTWCQQFSVLIRRSVKERSHESFSGLKITEVLLSAFLGGILWWKTDPSHLHDRVGLLFFHVGFWGFYTVFQAIFMFPQERKMLEKERSSGMYKLSSYFIALTIGDLPMELTLPTVFLLITYWMAGLRNTVVSFFTTLFVLLYGVLVFQGLGFAIGAAVMDMKAAVTLGSVIMLTSLLAGGFYVQNVPKFINWIKYLSSVQYMFKLMLIAQYKATDTYICDDNKICLVGELPSIKSVGLDGGAMALVAFTFMFVFYRLIAYVALMRIGATRRRRKILKS